MAVGIGFYEIALTAVLLMIFILTTLNKLDNIIRQKSHIASLYIELTDIHCVGQFIQYLRNNELCMDNFEMQNDIHISNTSVGFIATIYSEHKLNRNEILHIINNFDGKVFISEL